MVQGYNNSFLSYQGWTLDPLVPFGPTIEKRNQSGGTFLPDHPETLLRAGKFTKAPLMAGIDRNEGLLFAMPILANASLQKMLDHNWSKIVPVSQMLEGKIPDTKWAEAAQEIQKFYFGSAKVEENDEALEQMYSDRLFIHGIRATIQAAAKGGAEVYPYVFDYVAHDAGLRTIVPEKYADKVLHGEEQPYAFSEPTFGLPLNPSNTESTEYSKKFVKILVSFAKTG